MERKIKRKRNIKRDYRPKFCKFCEHKVNYIDFLDAGILNKFQTDNGRILGRRANGNCKIHQKMLTTAVKRARVLGLVL